MTTDAKGVYAIAATPFLEDGSIDFESIDTLVEFYLSHGVHGITVLGMMGEAPKLTGSESLAVAERFIRRVAGRVPVVVGASASGFAPMAELSKAVMDMGAAGIMVAPAAYVRGDAAIHRYFEGVMASVDRGTPVVVQDFPQATGVHMSPSAYVRLADEFPSIVMLKHEDCPGLDKITTIRATARRRTSLLVGNGALYYVQELERGADGAMTGFAYVEMLVRVHDLFSRGERQQAEDLFDIYLPLVRFEQQPGFGLAVRKEVLARRGAIANATQRRPAIPFSATDRQQLDGLVERLHRRLS
ncbi:MAG TPA: dihydrodipicolinate synthase family protein [Ramlibacter sp.]|nr:dihydrodipicolinate synthase family protein [Ramlibacter sp.]